MSKLKIVIRGTIKQNIVEKGQGCLKSSHECNYKLLWERAAGRMRGRREGRCHQRSTSHRRRLSSCGSRRLLWRGERQGWAEVRWASGMVTDNSTVALSKSPKSPNNYSRIPGLSRGERRWKFEAHQASGPMTVACPAAGVAAGPTAGDRVGGGGRPCQRRSQKNKDLDGLWAVAIYSGGGRAVAEVENRGQEEDGCWSDK
ncbi:transcription elongation factor regulatory protein [Striga asiatica]|uniref:Transcription elongation factor regulatory protein n=1 Tax=Striga asiatica TaxID=4170 RepID=A0A5A7QT00_STRAF|nr:transcription elongation factor regulatory protein [Striga asiatica]